MNCKEKRIKLFKTAINKYKKDREIINILEYKLYSTIIKNGLLIVQLSGEDMTIENLIKLINNEENYFECCVGKIFMEDMDFLANLYRVTSNDVDSAVSFFVNEDLGDIDEISQILVS